jgi:hypothetical protein
MNQVRRRSQVLRYLPGDSGRSVTLSYQTRSSDRSPGRAWARRRRKRCKFRPGARAGSYATGERVNLVQVARRDLQSLHREPTHLLGLPGGERRYEVGDSLQRGVEPLEVALAHSALMGRAAVASSVTTWTYVPAWAAACAASSSTTR